MSRIDFNHVVHAMKLWILAAVVLAFVILSSAFRWLVIGIAALSIVLVTRVLKRPPRLEYRIPQLTPAPKSGTETAHAKKGFDGVTRYRSVDRRLWKLWLVIREDYVQSWLMPILAVPAPSAKADDDTLDQRLLRSVLPTPTTSASSYEKSRFLDVLDEQIGQSLHRILRHVQSLPADWFIQLVTAHALPLFRRHIQLFKRASNELGLKRGTSRKHRGIEDDAGDIQQFYNHGRYHPALTSVGTSPVSLAVTKQHESELDYWRQVVMRNLMPLILQDSVIISPLLREILVIYVLQPTIDALSDSDYWNWTIDSLVGQWIEDQRVVSRLREVLERNSSSFGSGLSGLFDLKTLGRPTTASKKEKKVEKLVPTFEEYLKSIEQSEDILWLLRIRYTILTELRKRTRKLQEFNQIMQVATDIPKDKQQQVQLQQKKERDSMLRYIYKLNLSRKRAETRLLDRYTNLLNSAPKSLLQNSASHAHLKRVGSGQVSVMTLERGMGSQLERALSLETLIQTPTHSSSTNAAALSSKIPSPQPPASPLSDSALEDTQKSERLFYDISVPFCREVFAVIDRVWSLIQSTFDESDLIKSSFGMWVQVDDVSKVIMSISSWMVEKRAHGLSQSSESEEMEEVWRCVVLELDKVLREIQAEYFSGTPANGLLRQVVGQDLSGSLITLLGMTERMDSIRPVQQAEIEKLVQLLTLLSQMFERALTIVKKTLDRRTAQYQLGSTAAGSSSSSDASASKHKRNSSFPFVTDLVKRGSGFFGSDSSATASRSGSASAIASDRRDQSLVTRQSTVTLEAYEDARSYLEPEPSDAIMGELGDDVDVDEDDEDAETIHEETIESVAQQFQNIITETHEDSVLNDQEQTDDELLDDEDDEAETDEFEVARGSDDGLTDTESNVTDLSRDHEFDESETTTTTLNPTPGATKAPSETSLSPQPTQQGDQKESIENELKSLKRQMDKIAHQEALLDAMIEKVQREEDSKFTLRELKLMNKMKLQYDQERQALLMRKAQLELQIRDNVIWPCQTRISIPQWSYSFGDDVASDGQNSAAPAVSTLGRKGFFVFIIEVDQARVANASSNGWILARRYSEFHSLHKRLKARYPFIMAKPGYELPGKRYLHHLTSFKSPIAPASPNLQQRVPSPTQFDKKEREFMEERRRALQRYLVSLCADEVIARSLEFRQFLCQERFFKTDKGGAQNQHKLGFGGTMKRILSFGTNVLSGSSATSPVGTEPPSTKSFDTGSIVSNVSEAANTTSSEAVDIGPRKKRSFNFLAPFEAISSRVSGGTSNSRNNSIDSRTLTSQKSSTSNSTTNLGNSVHPPGVLNIPHIEVGDSAQIEKGIRESLSSSIQDNIPKLLITQSHEANISPDSPPYYPKAVSDPTSPAVGWPSGAPQQLGNAATVTSSTEVLSDIFIELFELKEKNNWLRRQAVLIILQQIFGGTIERRVTDNLKYLLSEDMLCWYLDQLYEVLRPSKPPPLRTQHDRDQTKLNAYRKLHLYLPDVMGSVAGRTNAKRGSTRIFDLVQNQKVNKELLYRVADVLVNEVFTPRKQ